jgi:uncharacterized protein (UPF0335 family)
MSLGHNSIGHLRRIVDRVESIEEEIARLNKEKSSTYKQAKDTGLVVKAVKAVVKARRLDPKKRAEEIVLFDTYFDSLEAPADSAFPGAEGEDPTAVHPTADSPPPDSMDEDGWTTVHSSEPVAGKEPEPEPEQEEEDDDSPFETEPDGEENDQEEPAPEEPQHNGERITPTVNMEFPDNTVPDELTESYD